MDIARWFANDAAIPNMTFLEAFERSGRRWRSPSVLLAKSPTCIIDT